MVILSPFVYWAQTEDSISLKIDLKSVINPNVDVLENKLKFTAHGVGAHGDNNYEFNLDLFAPIKSASEAVNGVTVRVFDSRVELILQKEKSSWWPRLTAQPQKPAWLKINFDLWKCENGMDDSGDESRDIMKDYPGMYDKLQQEELGYRKGNLSCS